MRWKDLSVELRDRIVSAQIWRPVPKHFCSIKGPKNTEASIILQWKKFGTTKTLPRAGHPAKLSNRGRRALVREVAKNPMVTLTELQSSSMEMRIFQKDNHLGRTPLIRPLW
uniref:Uncharacterized protein n=1 Tax=Oncorhynchus tshawytscha TaxID=74940 RepID=A0AAZ3NTS3_ONCTS